MQRHVSLHNISCLVFVCASFKNQWYQACKHPKTITIVAGQGQPQICTCSSPKLLLHKLVWTRTNTRIGSMCTAAGNPQVASSESRSLLSTLCFCCHWRQNIKYLSVSTGYTCEKWAAVGIMGLSSNHGHWLFAFRIQKIYVLLSWNMTENLLSQKPLPCRAPPGFHPELWIAQREPDRRCPNPLGQRSTEPPTRWWEACRTSAQNMAPMTQTVEGGGIWLLHPQVINN